MSDADRIDDWQVYDPGNDNVRAFSSRSDAEDAAETMRDLGVDVETYSPGKSPFGDAESETEADGGQPEIVEATAGTEEDALVDVDEGDLPERSVADDPLTWMPGHFIDQIDGTPAINRKGFEVLAHHYEISTTSDLEVPPEETGHEYCRVKARAMTRDGRECEAYGSAHVDRGDDPELLLEMADTRARKRALSIATGVGVVAVEELRNEVDR